MKNRTGWRDSEKSYGIFLYFFFLDLSVRYRFYRLSKLIYTIFHEYVSVRLFLFLSLFKFKSLGIKFRHGMFRNVYRFFNDIGLHWNTKIFTSFWAISHRYNTHITFSHGIIDIDHIYGSDRFRLIDSVGAFGEMLQSLAHFGLSLNLFN